MAIKALALILFLFSLPITLTVEGRCLVIAGLLGSFGASLIALQGGSFWVICSRFLLSFLGFGTVCLVRVDPYAVMFFAFFTLGIIDWTCRDGLSGSGASQIRDFRTGGVAQDDSNVLRAGISSGWCFGGVLAIAMFWFFLHVVFAATTTIWSLKTWHLILVHQSPAIFPVYGQIASLALLCGYMTLFSSSASARSFFLKGVHVGLWCAMPLVFLQLSGITLPYVSGEAPFWQHLNRHSGLFEDPNAFGVVTGLLLFIGMHQRWYLLSTCWMFLALFSGSRLFTLSLVILFIVWAVRIRQRALALWHIHWSPLILRCGVALLLAACFFCGIAYQLLSEANVLPDAVNRGFSALNVVRLHETFSTRLAFWKLGLEMFAHNPLAGVGFGNFERVMTSYARRDGNDLNLWTDTPNNFYLGLLSELGVIGFLIFLFELTKLSLNKSPEDRMFLQTGLFVFLLTLFFGAHIYFIECSLIGALLIGFCVKERRRETTRSVPALWILQSTVACGMLVLLFAVHRSMEYGWYPWERDIDGSYVRWAAPRAQALQVCRDDRVHFEISLPPERTVEIRSPHSVSTLNHFPASWQGVSVECRGATRLPLTFKVSKGWIPAVDAPETKEWRTLGVRIKQDPACMAAP